MAKWEKGSQEQPGYEWASIGTKICVGCLLLTEAQAPWMFSLLPTEGTLKLPGHSVLSP